MFLPVNKCKLSLKKQKNLTEKINHFNDIKNIRLLNKKVIENIPYIITEKKVLNH